MVFRFLIRFLLSDKVVDKLADSYPIRQAARWAIYFVHKAKVIKGDNRISLNENNLKIIKQVAVRLSHLFQRVQSIKPKSANEGSSFQNQTPHRSTNTNFADKNSKCEKSSLNKKESDKQTVDNIEESLRKYVQELKRRSKE